VHDIVLDIIGILFRSCISVGFWVVIAYVMGIYVFYELDIEEQYSNPLNYRWLNVV
jgi:hypothetical protein